MMVEVEATCPYCGAPIRLMVDTSQGPYETIEDCEVCCRPMQLNIDCEPGEVFAIETQRA
jgi:hypothetical protein